MDQQALLGTGGFFDPTAASQPLTPQADPSAATTYPEWAAILGMTVDGRRSANPSEGGLVMHPDGYNDADKPESTDGQGWTGRGHWKGERK